jgi:predicted site-specific integrase-resolvase
MFYNTCHEPFQFSPICKTDGCVGQDTPVLVSCRQAQACSMNTGKPTALHPGANQVLNPVSKTKQATIATLRISSQAQKSDLSNQRVVLEQFCIARGIAEIGGGLNFKRPKFSDMVNRIVRSELTTRVIAHKDRLARCVYELLAHLCETPSCQIVVLNTESLIPEQELLHCFSSRLYGLRNYRKAIQKAMADDQGTQDPAQSVA